MVRARRARSWARGSPSRSGTRIRPPAAAAIDAVIAEMHRIDALMSVYKPESQLSRVNRDAATAPVKVDPELARLISRALEFSEMSGGAFDITYASVGYLYDYREHKHPTEAQIQAALPAVNWRHVRRRLRRSTVRFLKPGRPHRPRRHRQGPCGRFLHRDPQGAGHHECDGDRRRRQPDPRRPPRPALDRRHPPSGRPRAA